MEVRIKKLNDTAIIPTLGSVEAAGCDIYANLAERQAYQVCDRL